MDRRPTGQELADGAVSAAHDVLVTYGENRESMLMIGEILDDFAASGALAPLIDAYDGAAPAVVQRLGTAPDGARLSLFLMDGWHSPPRADVHWHNYWQALTVVCGTWPDTVWRPVLGVSDGCAERVEIARREVLGAGAFQLLEPDEPHGWEADEHRAADGVVLLTFTTDSRGVPFTVLDPDTGAVSEGREPST